MKVVQQGPRGFICELENAINIYIELIFMSFFLCVQGMAVGVRLLDVVPLWPTLVLLESVIGAFTKMASIGRSATVPVTVVMALYR